MHIQINTDSNIEGRDDLAAQVSEQVAESLQRFADQITRVEVHLSDQNATKSGQTDKRCVMEVRIEGRQPTVATHDAATVVDAVNGAADKLKRAVGRTLERQQDRR
jgi:ribosomal subunit interface protein